MAADLAIPGRAAQGYRSNTVAGLSDGATFRQAAHGVVVHLKRASMVPAGADGQGRKAQHLANADNLLVFLSGLADDDTPLGKTLIKCYIGLQELIAAALNAPAQESERALGDALEQARALEATVGEMVDAGHGQSR